MEAVVAPVPDAALLCDLADAVDALVDHDPGGLPSRPALAATAENLIALTTAARRLDAVRTLLTGEFDESLRHLDEGATSAAAWYRAATGEAVATARARVRAARRLRSMPATTAALLAGRLTSRHVDALARASVEAPDAFADGGEALLVDQARTLDGAQMGVAVRHWLTLVTPSDEAARQQRLVDGRRAHVSTTYGDTVVVDAVLDPASGHEVVTTLDAFVDIEHRRDLTQRDAALADGAAEHQATALLRTLPQRRADALVAMAVAARHHLTDCTPPVPRDLPASSSGSTSSPDPTTRVRARSMRTRPRVEVTATLDQLCAEHGVCIGTRAAGSPLRIPAAVARMHACDCDLATVVVDGESGAPLHYGRSARVVPLRLRRYLERRDGGCRVPGCDAPSGWCDAHHLVHWVDGGTTDPDNCALICSAHHRMIHQGHLAVTGGAEGDDLRVHRRAGPPLTARAPGGVGRQGLAPAHEWAA